MENKQTTIKSLELRIDQYATMINRGILRQETNKQIRIKYESLLREYRQLTGKTYTGRIDGA